MDLMERQTMRHMKAKRIYQVLMILQGIFWCWLCVSSAVMPQTVPLPVTILMGVNAVCFTGFAFLFDRARWLNILALLFLLGNLILTVTDQMGVYDWIALALNLLTLAAWFYQNKQRGNATR